MDAYEQGFDRGEREAFQDRHVGPLKPRPWKVDGDYWLGYWDGYTPRAREWGNVAPVSHARPAVVEVSYG